MASISNDQLEQMNIQLLHYGTFALNESGKPVFVPDDPAFFRINCEGLIGKRVEIDIRQERRSSQANKYYWGVIVHTFVNHFNQHKTFDKVVDSDFVHDVLRAKFIGLTKQVLPGGEILEMIKSSARLTVSEFSDYVKYCKTWGEEFFGIEFPEMENEQT